MSVFTDLTNSRFVETLSTEWMLEGGMLVREDKIVELSANGSDNGPSLLWKDSPACEIRVATCSRVYVDEGR